MKTFNGAVLWDAELKKVWWAVNWNKHPGLWRRLSEINEEKLMRAMLETMLLAHGVKRDYRLIAPVFRSRTRMAAWSHQHYPRIPRRFYALAQEAISLTCSEL